DLVRMRNARGVFGDVAVIGERRDHFSVPEARRAQDQPRGLEDGDTAFSECLRWDVLQAGHCRLLGSESCTSTHFGKHRGGAGLPPPLFGPSLWSPPVRTECRRITYVSSGLLGRSLRHRNDGDEGAVFRLLAERDTTVDQRKQRMVHTYAHVRAGVPLRAALTYENLAGKAELPAEQLHAKALARRVAAVSRRSACFLVCHEWNLSSGTT